MGQKRPQKAGTSRAALRLSQLAVEQEGVLAQPKTAGGNAGGEAELHLEMALSMRVERECPSS